MAHQPAPTIGRLDLFKTFPILVVIAGVIGSAYVGNWRLDAQAGEITTNQEAIETNQLAIQGLVRSLDRTNADLELEITRLQSQLKLADSAQAAQLRAILLALQELKGE